MAGDRAPRLQQGRGHGPRKGRRSAIAAERWPGQPSAAQCWQHLATASWIATKRALHQRLAQQCRGCAESPQANEVARTTATPHSADHLSPSRRHRRPAVSVEPCRAQDTWTFRRPSNSDPDPSTLQYSGLTVVAPDPTMAASPSIMCLDIQWRGEVFHAYHMQ